MISEVQPRIPIKATMKVTQVALIPAEASAEAGRPALTPELLAASGARYSRNNEGLDAILSKIDPNNLDKSVESIFKMVDYGHQSIADMVPVAIFMDNLSLWLAYFIWTICPTAGGQESSTRYIKLSNEGLLAPELLGENLEFARHWQETMASCFDAYQGALDLFDGLFAEAPKLAKIPAKLLSDQSPRAIKQAQRMQRNFSFDRARYLLPAAALTNVMMIMSARGWATLCQHLLSHPLPESVALGTMIRCELELCAPRMVRHAELKPSNQAGQKAQFDSLVAQALKDNENFLGKLKTDPAQLAGASLEVHPPQELEPGALAAALLHHENRYAYIGDALSRTSVRFAWKAMALAEIRDLNRHRTGSKYCPLIPRGFYFALDQIPAEYRDNRSQLIELAKVGVAATEKAWQLLCDGDPRYVYYTVLGTQYSFEHLTPADKFIYEAELRTGTGAHYRYAEHLRDALNLWYEKFPDTKALIHEGEAEPE